MKYAKQSLVITSLVVALVIGILLYGKLTERDHPDEYYIPFDTLISQPDDITCGPTSATMVLNRYGKNLTVDEVQKITKTRWITYKGKNYGTTAIDYMAIGLRHFGLPAKVTTGNIHNLKYYVSQNKPVIVVLRSGTYLWHYVVVIGYDKDNIQVADPGGGTKYNIPTPTFINAWNYSSDMDGNKVGYDCPACQGNGCIICLWTGRIDPFLDLYRKSDVPRYTMIVPHQPLP